MKYFKKYFQFTAGTFIVDSMKILEAAFCYIHATCTICHAKEKKKKKKMKKKRLCASLPVLFTGWKHYQYETFVITSLCYCCCYIAGWDWRPLNRQETSRASSHLIKQILTADYNTQHFCAGISMTIIHLTGWLVFRHLLFIPFVSIGRNFLCFFLFLPIAFNFIFFVQLLININTNKFICLSNLC